MADEKPPEKIVKVKMLRGGFDPDHGTYREGGVYEYPQEQAIRVCKSGLARPAPSTARTARDEDRALKLKDAAHRQEVEDLDREMSSAWDIDVRDVERREFEAEAAERQADEATEAVKVAQAARKSTHAAPPAAVEAPA